MNWEEVNNPSTKQQEEESDDEPASPRSRKQKTSGSPSAPNKDRNVINKRATNDYPFPSWCLRANGDYYNIYKEIFTEDWSGIFRQILLSDVPSPLSSLVQFRSTGTDDLCPVQAQSMKKCNRILKIKMALRRD
jgi:hypothetical protein